MDGQEGDERQAAFPARGTSSTRTNWTNLNTYGLISY